MDFKFRYDRKPRKENELRDERRQESDLKKRMRGLAVGLSIPSTMIAGPLLGWFIGNWLDNRLGTGYWMVVLIIIGTVAGFKVMIDMLVKLGREQ